VGRLYLSILISPKKNRLIEAKAIAVVNKLSPCTNTVSFENEIVPLNGRIQYSV